MTQAYVATSEVRAFRRSQRYAENAIHEPNTIRYPRARTDAVENRSGSTSASSPRETPHRAIAPPAIITIALPTNGRCGSRALRATRDPRGPAHRRRDREEQARQGVRRRSRRRRAAPRRRTRGRAHRHAGGRGWCPTKRSYSAIQSGTSAKISATVPLGIVRSGDRAVAAGDQQRPDRERRPPLRPAHRVARRVAPADRDGEQHVPAITNRCRPRSAAAGSRS